MRKKGSPSEPTPEPKADPLDRHIDREFAQFAEMCPIEQEPVLTVLRAHLLTEYYIERLLVLGLPRGDRLVHDGNLSYAQKLGVLEALDILPDKTIQSLKALNRVRNGSAHEMNREVSVADVERIGRPLGPEFTALRREHYPDVKILLFRVLSSVCRDVTFQLYELEAEAAEEYEESKEEEENSPNPNVRSEDAPRGSGPGAA
jgi:hypothetical protein